MPTRFPLSGTMGRVSEDEPRCLCLAKSAWPGDRCVFLDTAISDASALKFRNHALRCTEVVSIDPEQPFPSATIFLASPLRTGYEQGEIVQPVTDW